MTVGLPYRPDRAVAPGFLLQEHLEAREMSAREFARRCGRSPKLIVEILSGKAPVEPDTALQFGRVLGLSADVWLGMEATYRLHLAAGREEAQLAGEGRWAASFPLAELAKRGVLAPAASDGDRVRQLLAFFGAGSVAACRERFDELASVSYRHSKAFKSDETALLAWLRLGEMDAEATRCPDYDRARFLEALHAIRPLSRAPIDVALPRAAALCASAGVAFVLVKPLKGVALSGISRWLSPRKGLIQQSLRHKADDHFWFTFFHEAAHLLLHSRKAVFLDEGRHGSADPDQEREADDWAADFLVPKTAMRAFLAGFGGTAPEVEAFAARSIVAPGIVVGQLQKRGVVPYNRMNGLKVRLGWVDD